MSKAAPGLLYAHPVVLEHSRTLFATEPAGPFEMKGKALPLLVYSVGEESGTRESGEGGRLPLLGRDAELAELRDALDRAFSGEGGVVTVTGTTGMGKTRLVREAAVGARGRRPPHRACRALRRVELLPGLPRPAPPAARHRAGDSRRTWGGSCWSRLPLPRPTCCRCRRSSPTSRTSRCRPPPRRTRSTRSSARTGLPTCSSISSAASSPVRSSSSPRRPTGRTSPPPTCSSGSPAPRVAVHGRWPPFVAGWKAASSRRPDPRSRSARCRRTSWSASSSRRPRPRRCGRTRCRRSSSAPRATRCSSRRSPASPAPPAPRGTMPDTLQAAMAAQIDVLEPTERRILRTAAVLGRSFRREVLRETLSADGLTRDPGRLTQLSDFLEADGPERLRFRNSLVRDAAYEELAYKTRARLHRAAGLATERLSADLVSDAPTLSLHFSRAGDDERTWTYGRMAGESARRAYANADAAAQYELALDAREAARRSGDRARSRRWTLLGELRELAGMLDASIAAYRRAAAPRRGRRPSCRPNSWSVARSVHERAGAHITALAGGEQGARRLLEPSRRGRCRPHAGAFDAVTAFIRLGQERLKEARPGPSGAAEGARASRRPRDPRAGSRVHRPRRDLHGHARARASTRGRPSRSAWRTGGRPRESIARMQPRQLRVLRRPLGRGGGVVPSAVGRPRWRPATPSARPRRT